MPENQRIGRKEWIKRHEWRPHHWKFKDLGWKWTPSVCKCGNRCYVEIPEGY